MDLTITTKNLTIAPFTLDHLEPYRQEFTPEVTKYQYPDPFPDLEAASQTLSNESHMDALYGRNTASPRTFISFLTRFSA